jgi:hypothetical protein
LSLDNWQAQADGRLEQQKGRRYIVASNVTKTQIRAAIKRIEQSQDLTSLQMGAKLLGRDVRARERAKWCITWEAPIQMWQRWQRS